MGDPDYRVRSAFAASLPVRFAQASAPTVWGQAGGPAIVINAILSAIADGRDRAILAWPERPCGGGVAAALALRSARSNGKPSFATLAIWPWRSGTMAAARSVLVNPDDVVKSARRIATACILEKPRWTQDGLAHESLALCELRLADVGFQSPTLCETTVVFPAPSDPPHIYRNNDEQILQRVFRYTSLKKSPELAKDRRKAAGDALCTPHAIFGIPGTFCADEIRALLSYRRFSVLGLDVVLVDVTRTALAHVSDDWEDRLEFFLAQLMGRRELRPSVVVLSDDPWTYQRAGRLLHARARRLGIPLPLESGLYSPDGALLGREARAPIELPLLRFEADIKDAGLGPLRLRLLQLADGFRGAEGESEASRAVKRVLADLRRLASLPMGLREAREAAEDYHAGENIDDLAVRALFLPHQSVALLRAAAAQVSRNIAETHDLCNQILKRAEAWQVETPISAKLFRILEADDWNRADTLISFADGRIADLFSISDRGTLVACAIATHNALGDPLVMAKARRLIIISPNPTAIRFLLETTAPLERVALLSDSAGVPLLLSMLAPIERLKEFGAIGARTAQLRSAFAQLGTDDGLDTSEAQFRIRTASPDALDFTQQSGCYRGEIVSIITATGRELRYRPGSTVLLATDGEIRPFVAKRAKSIKTGDAILVLSNAVREILRGALMRSEKANHYIGAYHKRVKLIREDAAGGTIREKARSVVRSMKKIDPALSDAEIGNVTRWLQADLQILDGDLGRVQPRTARDWSRFKTFMKAVEIDEVMAHQFWEFAILPTRSYRAQEGYAFNETIVKFVLDPEGLGLIRGGWVTTRALLTTIEEAVDDVVSISTSNIGVQDGTR